MTRPAITAAANPREGWDRIAPGFDEHTTPVTLALGTDVVRRLGVGPGQRFLDVAAGSGALAIPAARTGARVVATDVAPGMIERLRARARAAGLTDLDARVMDGMSLDIDDGVFDVAASQNGVSLFPDPDRGIAEMARVTRSGGRVAVIAFGPPPRAEFIAFCLSAMRAVVPGFQGLPADPPPPPFRFADSARLHDALVRARLRDVRVEPIQWRAPFRSAQHLRDVFVSSNPIGARLYGALNEDQKKDVLRVLEGMLRERAGGNGHASLTADMNLGVGTP